MITFTPDLIVSSTMYEELSMKKNREDSMTDKEKLQLWVYDAAVEWWGIDPKMIDSKFFNSYIGQCNGKSINTIIELHHSASRFMDLISNNLQENDAAFKNKLDWLKKQDDPNLELYSKKHTEYYGKLIEGQTLLETLLDREDCIKLTTEPSGLPSANIEIFDYSKFYTYMDNMPEDKYKYLVDLFGFKKQCWSGAQYEFKINGKKRTIFISTIIHDSFGIRLEDNGHKNTTHPKYGGKILINTFLDLIDVYKSSIFYRNTFDFKVMLGDDVDELDL